MKIAAAIVTNRGGRTCHAAIIARELGIPAVVGAEDATASSRLARSSPSRAPRATSGSVYRGEVGFHVDRIESSTCSGPAPQVMMNLGNPDLGLQTSFLPNDGVGLARMEFIITNTSRSTRWPCCTPEKVDDPKLGGRSSG